MKRIVSAPRPGGDAGCDHAVDLGEVGPDAEVEKADVVAEIREIDPVAEIERGVLRRETGSQDEGVAPVAEIGGARLALECQPVVARDIGDRDAGAARDVVGV